MFSNLYYSTLFYLNQDYKISDLAMICRIYMLVNRGARCLLKPGSKPIDFGASIVKNKDFTIILKTGGLNPSHKTSMILGYKISDRF